MLKITHENKGRSKAHSDREADFQACEIV